MTANATLDPADPLGRATPGRKVDRHLHQVDLVRVLVFAAVIMVHTLSKTNGDASQSAGALQDALHFTREAFFALSGFVLVYGHDNSSQRAGSMPGPGFLSRRMRLVAVPYLAWTIIYWAVDEALNPRSALLSVRELGYDVVTGGASYHLYFLLVTMQIYLAFRLLLRVLYATRGHHLALLVGTAVFEAALTGWLHYLWTPGHAGGALVAHADLLLPSYLLWVVGGGVAAMHREAFDGWVRAHTATVALSFVAGLVLVETSYIIELMNGADPVHASDVLQPFTLVWSAVAIVALYAVGLRWAADRDGAPRARRVLGARVAQASLGSFGVFLVHPLVLHLLVAHGLGPLAFVMPKIASTLLAYALTVFGAVILVAIFLHTRLATTLTGRPRIRAQAGRAPVHRATGGGTRGLRGRAGILTPARVALLLSMVVFATAVVALSHANVARQNRAAAADEFNPVNSLVTTPTAPAVGATRAPAVSGPPIQQNLTLTSGGVQRTYLLVTPNGPTTGLPLLVFLHGVTTTAGEELARDGFLPLAATGQAVLVYPGGIQGSWDAGDGCCGAALDQHVDDVSFIHTLVSTIQADQHTDVKRTYLDGYSNGAKLVWTIACTSPAGFAGYAEYGGNPDPCPTRVQAPIFWGVGMMDGTEPIAGKPADTRGPHPAVQPELSDLLARNGCIGPGAITTASSATITSWTTTCTKAPVTYVVWATADHHWPRPPTVDPIGSAATLMWAFFSAQHL